MIIVFVVFLTIQLGFSSFCINTDGQFIPECNKLLMSLLTLKRGVLRILRSSNLSELSNTCIPTLYLVPLNVL